MHILVTGAGGKTGRAVVAALERRGVTVRPFLRQRTVLSSASKPIVGDMTDPNDWKRAMNRAEKVYHICPNMHEAEVEIGRLAIASARDAGVSHFVYHSVLHPQTEAMIHHWNKLRVEELLLESQLPFTILQPTAYMQNLHVHWQSIKQTGAYVVPYPVETRISLVDLLDVAEVAATVLTESGHEGSTYELVGTPPLSQLEVGRMLGEVNGRHITVKEIALAAWERKMKTADMTPYATAALLKMFRYYAAYGLVGNPTVLRCLLGRKPTLLTECAQRW